MRPGIVAQVAGLVLIGVAFHPVPVHAQQGGQIECRSSGYHYNYCRVNTGNAVRLAHQQSGTACRQGQNWGYDARGIWVDQGCGAIFEYGYGGGPQYGGGYRHASHDNGGEVAGALAAAVILAAVAGSSHHHADRPSYNQQYHQQYSRVPDWAVGTWSGTDSASGSDVSMNINQGGYISGYYGHSRLDGQIDGTHAYLGSRGYRVAPSGGGIRLISDDGQMVIDLYRD